MPTPPPLLPDPSLEGLQHRSEILVLGSQQYWELYPTDEALSFRRIERPATGIGLVLTLATSFEFAALEVTDEGHALVTTDDAVVTALFPDEQAMEPQFHSLTLTALSTSGERTAPHRLRLQFASKARDAASGRSTHDRVIVKETDLKLSYSFIKDWIIETPTDDDRAYAQRRWGDLVAADAPPYTRARV